MFLYWIDYLLPIKAKPLRSYWLTWKLRLLSSAHANDLGVVQKITAKVSVPSLCMALTCFVCNAENLLLLAFPQWHVLWEPAQSSSRPFPALINPWYGLTIQLDPSHVFNFLKITMFIHSTNNTTNNPLITIVERAKEEKKKTILAGGALKEMVLKTKAGRLAALTGSPGDRKRKEPTVR